VLTSSFFLGCKEDKKETVITLDYPETKLVDSTDTYFGEVVKDPYRWLEDDRSEQTGAWVKAQNEVTFGYLNQISYREALKNRLSALWNYEKISSPFVEGENTFYYKNDGLQNHYVVYKKKGDTEEIFLDPNTFSKDGTTSLDDLSFSKSGKLAAYSISEGGSDWRKVVVIDVETKNIIGDSLKDLKFSDLSWKGDEGFYYSTYDKPKGSQLSAKTAEHKLYFHKIGTAQKEDAIVFGKKDSEKGRYIGGTVTEDNRYLIIS